MHDHPPTADPMSDAALLAQVAAGGEAAFVAVYRRHRDDVYRFAYAMAKSASAAQDVTQEVFLNVLENAARFDPEKGSARAWLLGCARHVILDRLRLERRWAAADQAPEETVPCANEDRVLAEQRLDRLHAAIAALPIEYREALVLCELQELTYAECAAVLECPIGTVRSRLHRARLLLATALAGAEVAALDPPTTLGSAPAAVLKPSEVCS
jgi:RNA polymerase sigma-70 factor (ECF subfamily)